MPGEVTCLFCHQEKIPSISTLAKEGVDYCRCEKIRSRRKREQDFQRFVPHERTESQNLSTPPWVQHFESRVERRLEITEGKNRVLSTITVVLFLFSFIFSIILLSVITDNKKSIDKLRKKLEEDMERRKKRGW